jgi:uncharacterized membrane protein YbaN (DUF454 family)
VAAPGPSIEIDSKGRAIRIRDTRLINSSRRAFCQHLISAATRRPGISKAEIDITAASCRIEFTGGSTTAHTMADSFADCVRDALASSSTDTRRTDRLSADWLTLTAYPISGDVSLWETHEAPSGRMHLGHQSAVDDEDRLSKLAEAISDFEQVKRCRRLPRRQGLAIEFLHENSDLNGFLDEAERSLEDLIAAEPKQRAPRNPAASFGGDAIAEVATGPKRVLYLAMAGGAFFMTLVGLVVPGIPTIPFLLATSYFLARSSRSLNERLRGSAFFGPIIVDWEQHGALSRSSKSKLIGLTVIIVTVAIALSPLSPIGILILLAIASFSIYGITQMPDLPQEKRAGDSPDGAARFALPAP